MSSDPDHASPAGLRRFLVLALGSVGIVYGDIGTSPLYAFRESISHLRSGAGALVASNRATHQWLGGPGQWLLALPVQYIAGSNVLARSLSAGTTAWHWQSGCTDSTSATRSSRSAPVASP